MPPTPERAAGTARVSTTTQEEVPRRNGEAACAKGDVRRLFLPGPGPVRAALPGALLHVSAQPARGPVPAPAAALHLPPGPHPLSLGVPHRPGAGRTARGLGSPHGR